MSTTTLTRTENRARLMIPAVESSVADAVPNVSLVDMSSVVNAA